MSERAEGLAASFRPLRTGDLALVMHNENRAYSHPWGEAIFHDCLAGMYQCWVMENARRRLFGHAVVQRVLDEAHLLNLCIAPEFHGQGLGRRFLHFLLDTCQTAGVTSFYLEVRVSNAAALSLYRSEGFTEIGRRKGYYPCDKGREDGVVMVRGL